MTATELFMSIPAGIAPQSAFVVYAPLGTTGIATSPTETPVTWRRAGVISGMRLVVSANTSTGAGTVTLRKNTADAGNTISIGAGLTGEFTSSASDSIASGDLMAVSYRSGSGGTMTVQALGVVWNDNGDATTQSTTRCGTIGASSITSNSASVFLPLIGSSASPTTDTQRIRFRGTAVGATNLFVRVTTNARTSASTVSLDASGVAQLSTTVGAGLTGVFEQTGTVAIGAAPQDLSFEFAMGTGAGETFGVTQTFVDVYDSTDGKFPAAEGGQATVTFNTTRFFPIAGQCSLTATESPVQISSDLAAAITNLTAVVSTNGITAATTVDVRVAGASSAVTLSIASGLTGTFEDTTHSATIAAGQKVNMRVAAGATGTSIVFQSLAATVGGGPSAARPRRLGMAQAVHRAAVR